MSPAEANGDADDEYLDCGKVVNFTYYDNLVGVARRHRHPNVPEPQVSFYLYWNFLSYLVPSN